MEYTKAFQDLRLTLDYFEAHPDNGFTLAFRGDDISVLPKMLAAPDLYEALREIKGGSQLNQDNETAESLRYVVKAVIEIAEKALAKAEG